VIFRGNLPNPNPNQTWLTHPRSKIFDLDASLLTTNAKYIQESVLTRHKISESFE